MIAARNDYFDVWNYPLVLLVAWSLNVVLALLGACLLYQAASKAKAAMLDRLSRQMVQALGLGKDHEVRVKQIQYVIDEVEENEQGAFVPLYQQPVVESSLYGLVALLQYLYLG
jgi:ABC-type transport system involved in cytochrome bd biosynthesis fused ATPase/permease subunit